jgi:hypothetical protein
MRARSRLGEPFNEPRFTRDMGRQFHHGFACTSLCPSCRTSCMHGGGRREGGEGLRSCLLSPVRLAVCTYSTDLKIPTLLFLFLKLQVEVPSFPMCRMRARMNPSSAFEWFTELVKGRGGEGGIFFM